MLIEKLSIVIPCYNEANTIHLLLERVLKVQLLNGIKKEIIVVDDCSKDKTREAIIRFFSDYPEVEYQLLSHEVNKGKGAALHTGILNATGDYLIIQDADLEYDPEEYNLLIKPVLDGFADVVYGSRFMGGNPHRILFFWHSIGNKFLTFLSNAFTNLNLTDLETCYKLFPTKMIQGLHLEEKRFGFEPEVTSKISRVKGVRIYEVGISYYGRTYEEGKKIGWKDGFRAIWCILKYNLNARFRKIGLGVSLLLMSFLSLYSIVKFNGAFNDHKSNVIRSDGMGYYSFLPAIFIYNDMSQSFLPEVVRVNYKEVHIPEYMEDYKGKWVDKYFTGTAFLWLPFFFGAHIMSHLLNLPADGFSICYQYSIVLASLIYLWIGLYFLFKLFRSFNAGYAVSIFILFLLSFGTHLFHYAFVEPSMSHVYSFSMISCFMYFSRKFLLNHRRETFLLAILFLSIVFIIRPLNILIVLAVPVLSPSARELWLSLKNILSKPIWLLLAFLVVFIIISFQLLVWYLETGYFFVSPYSRESFFFNQPHLLDIWFSYKKGFFIYTPVAFLSLIGLLGMWKRMRFPLIGFVVFFFVLSYVTSCWYMWYYGGSFGFRPFVEYLPLFGILLVFAFQSLRKFRFKFILVLICLLTLVLNQIQAYQYRHYIIHMSNMSMKKYWKLFLKTDSKWNGYPYQNFEGADIVGNPLDSALIDFEKPVIDFYGGIIKSINDAKSGQSVMVFDSLTEYGITWVKNMDSSLILHPRIGIIYDGFIKPLNGKPGEKIVVAASISDSNDSLLAYDDSFIDWSLSSKKTWQKFSAGLFLNGSWPKGSRLKIYLWNIGKQSDCLFDDLSIKVIDQKE